MHLTTCHFHRLPHMAGDTATKRLRITTDSKFPSVSSCKFKNPETSLWLVSDGQAEPISCKNVEAPSESRGWREAPPFLERIGCQTDQNKKKKKTKKRLLHSINGISDLYGSHLFKFLGNNGAVSRRGWVLSEPRLPSYYSRASGHTQFKIVPP